MTSLSTSCARPSSIFTARRPGFVEAVEVDERFNGEVVWRGAVKVFELEAGARCELASVGCAIAVDDVHRDPLAGVA